MAESPEKPTIAPTDIDNKELQEKSQHSASKEKPVSEASRDSATMGSTILFKRDDSTDANTVTDTGNTDISGTTGRQQFSIVRPHAQGGLGTISLAVDRAFGRQVALKEIRVEQADNLDKQRRFLNEARITGQLEHPGIVPVYALGKDEQGRPYYAMKFVHGETFSDAIDRYHNSADPQAFRSLLQRYVDVCQAIAYAHSKGVIHRDLKPANMMLGEYGETLVLDWGLAKQVDEIESDATSAHEQLVAASQAERDGADADNLTQDGQVLGTPSYMAPEQAGGRLKDLGPAVDIYALGAVLYKILSGKVPYSGKSARDIVTQVLQEAPPKPSLIKRGIDPALQAICQKAMSRRPEDRFQTASELAEEVERWLADEPVQSHRDSLSVRAMRWARRHRVIVSGTGILALTVIVALAIGAALINQERINTDRARTDEEAQRIRAEKRELETRRYLYSTEISRARDAVDKGDLILAREILESLRPKKGESDHRGFEWDYLWRLVKPHEHTLRANAMLSSVIFSRDNKTILAGGGSFGLERWSLEDGEKLADWKCSTNWLDGLTISPDKSLLVSLSRAKQQQLIVFDYANGKELASIPIDDSSVSRIAMSGVGNLLAVAHRDGLVEVVDLSSHKTVSSFSTHPSNLYTVAYAPDGKTIVTTGHDKTIRSWEPDTGREISRVAVEQWVYRLKFSPDGKLLLAGQRNGEIRAFFANGLTPAFELSGHSESVYSLAFSPDGSMVASTGNDRWIRLWDVKSKQQRIAFRRGRGTSNLVFSSDGQRLAAISGMMVEVWSLDELDDLVETKTTMLRPPGIFSGAISPDGKWLATGSDDRKVTLRNVVTGQIVKTLTGHEGALSDVAFSPDSQMIASSSFDNTVRLWHVSGGRLHRMLPHTFDVYSVKFSPDGGLLATCGDSAALKIWNVASGEERFSIQVEEKGPIKSIAFSPDGRLLATAGTTWNVRLWDTATWKEIRSFQLPGHSTHRLVFAKDGKSLIRTGGGRIVRWDVSTGETLAVTKVSTSTHALGISPDGESIVVAHQWGRDTDHLATISLHDKDGNPEFGPANTRSIPNGRTYVALFTPDGKQIICGHYDGTISRWDAPRFNKTHSYGDRARGIRALAYSPDGSLLALARFDFTVQLIDTSTGEEWMRLRGHENRVTSVAFSTDGRRLASGSLDQTARIWNVEKGKVESVVPNQRLPVRAVAFSRDGSTLAIGMGITDQQQVEINLWDIASKSVSKTLKGHPCRISYLAFAPRGNFLASGTGGSWPINGEVKIWDIDTGAQRSLFTGHVDALGEMRFSPDGKLLATVGIDRMVRLWDWTQVGEVGTPLATLAGAESPLLCADFSPDNRLFAAGDKDGNVIIWDVALRRRLARFPAAQRGLMTSLSFSPDGQTLATATNYGELRFWRTASDDRQIPDMPSGNDPLARTEDPEFQLAIVRRETTRMFADSGALSETVKSYEKTIRHLEKLVAAHPEMTAYLQELSIVHSQLGLHFEKAGLLDKSATEHRAALTWAKKYADAKPNDPELRRLLATGNEELADVLFQRDNEDEAILALRKSIAAWQRLLVDNPLSREYHSGFRRVYKKLQDIYSDSKRTKESLDLAVELLASLGSVRNYVLDNSEFDLTVIRLHLNASDCLKRLKRYDEAEQQARQGLSISQEHFQDYPNNSVWQEGVSLFHNRLGNALSRQQKIGPARAAHLSNLNYVIAVLYDKPDSEIARNNVRIACSLLRTSAKSTNSLSDRDEQYREMILLLENRLTQSPHFILLREELAKTLSAYVVFLRGRSKTHPEVAEAARRALEIRKSLLEDFPSEARYASSAAGNASSLGISLSALERKLESAKAFLEACRLYHLAASAEVDNDQHYDRFIANAKVLRTAIQSYDDQEYSAELLRELVELSELMHALSPKKATVRGNLVITLNALEVLLSKLKQYGEAEMLCRRMLTISKDLRDEFPEKTIYINYLGTFTKNMAMYQYLSGRKKESFATYIDACKYRMETCFADPAKLQYRSDLLSTAKDFRNRLKIHDELNEAVAPFRELASIQEKVLKMSPDDVELRESLAYTLAEYDRLLGDKLKRNTEAEKIGRRAFELRQSLATEFPENIPCVYRAGLSANNLGVRLAALNRQEEAVTAYRDACRFYVKAIHAVPESKEYHEEFNRSAKNLRGRLKIHKNLTAAEAWFRELASVQQQVLKKSAGDVELRESLAYTLAEYDRLLGDKLKRNTEAEKIGRRAFELRQSLATEFPENIPCVYRAGLSANNLGVRLAALNRQEEAITAYRDACRFYIKAIHAVPESKQYLDEFNRSANNLRKRLRIHKKPEEAAAWFRELVFMQEQVLEKSSDNVKSRATLAHTLEDYELLLGVKLKRDAEAEKICRRSLELKESLVKEFPENAIYTNSAGVSANNLGVRLVELKRYKEADIEYTKSLKLFAEAEEKGYSALNIRERSSTTHSNRARALLLNKRVPESLKEYRHVLQLRQELINDYPKTAKYRDWIAATYNQISWILVGATDDKIRDPAEAVLMGNKAIEFAPTVARYRRNLGIAYYRHGKSTEAIESLKKAVELSKQGTPYEWLFLAMASKKLGKDQEAKVWHEKAESAFMQKPPSEIVWQKYRQEAKQLLDDTSKP